MGLPEISDLSEAKAANGGGVVRNLIGFFTKTEVVGRPAWNLKFPVFVDSTISLLNLASSLLAISSIWRTFEENSESPRRYREYLAESWISGLSGSIVAPSTRNDTLPHDLTPKKEHLGLDPYLEIGIHLAILVFYIHRCTLSLKLLHTLCPNVSINLRAKCCQSWLQNTYVCSLIYMWAFVIGRDIPKFDAVRLLFDNIRFCISAPHLREFCDVILEIQRKEGEQNDFKGLSPWNWKFFVLMGILLIPLLIPQ